MNDPVATFVGSLARLVVETDADGARLELAVGGAQLRFEGVVGLVLGDSREPLSVGDRSTVVLEIHAYADAGWEGVRFRVANTEQDLPLVFYCAGWAEGS